MDAEFWHQKWQNNEIGFHQNTVNPFLLRYFETLSLEPGQAIFLPLCGKTLDIGWLLSKSYQVIGIELHEPAVKALFEQLALVPEISRTNKHIKYSYDRLTIFVGDIFDLSVSDMCNVDAVYDRAALVALPKAQRADYVKQIQLITNKAPQLIVNYEYDHTLMTGPPFSVPNDEIKLHFQDSYLLKQLYSGKVEGGMKGKIPAEENVWLLNRK